MTMAYVHRGTSPKIVKIQLKFADGSNMTYEPGQSSTLQEMSRPSGCSVCTMSLNI